MMEPASSTFQEDDLRYMALEIFFRPTWERGHLLSEYIFKPNPDSHPPIHPSGLNGEWTASNDFQGCSD